MSAGLSRPRKGHEVDSQTLLNYLKANLRQTQLCSTSFLDAATHLTIQQFDAGQSNPTYLITLVSQQHSIPLVLRKKPPGNLLPSAHDVAREYTILKALSSTPFPVPRVYHLCQDAGVVGTPFYLMQYVQGRIFDDVSLKSLQRVDRAEIYEELTRVLAMLHSIDYASIGLGDLGAHWDYASRQLNRWTKQYKSSKTQDIPEMEQAIDYLSKNIPQDNDKLSVICHGDYRLGNVIFHPTENKIIAVLDWEITTIGHPYADLGYSSMMYCIPSKTSAMGLKGLNLHKLGIPSQKEFVASYFKWSIKLGISNIMNSFQPSGDAEWLPRYKYFLTLSAFRMAAILQGVYARSLKGNASSTKATMMGKQAVLFAKLAANLAGETRSLLFPLESYQELPISLIPFKNLFSPKFFQLRGKVLAFMDEYIYPNELIFAKQHGQLATRWAIPPIMEVLKQKAKSKGLWNLFLPESNYGAGLTNAEYAPLCEIMGRVPHMAPEIFNCSAPDTGNMEVFARYGTLAQQEKWLKPLLEGTIRSCFAMTEPAVASSDASNISCRIERVGDHYVINGRKWWISGAMDPRCKVAILMGKTNPKEKLHRQQSMIIVPVDSPGFQIIRPLTVFGYDDAPHGHAEIVLDNVRVPVENILLGEGRGFEIAQGRLGPGRIHHCMRCIGMAERALEAMCSRIQRRRAFGKYLWEQGVVQESVGLSRIEIEESRLLTMQAAVMMDSVGNKMARQHIAMIKVAAPNMALRVVDRAIQAFGAAGLSADVELASFFSGLRTLRFADGPDAVHLRTIALMEVSQSRL